MEVLEEILEFVENEDGGVVIKMIKGKYKGLVIGYGDVALFPVGEKSVGNVKFSYEILENPTNIEEDDEFYEFFGALVVDVLENYLTPMVKDINLEEYNLEGTDEELRKRIQELKSIVETERNTDG